MDGNLEINVLLVEDSEDFIFYFQKNIEKIDIEKYNFQLQIKRDGYNALKYLSDNFDRIDFAIIDLNIPEIDGLKLISEIKTNEDYKTIKIIVVTAYDSERRKREAESFGIDGYVLKNDDFNHVSQSIIKRIMETLDVNNMEK